MSRRLIAVLALTLLTTAACGTRKPNSASVSTTEGSITDTSAAGRNDVVFDNNMDGMNNGAAGSQENLVAQAGSDRVFFGYDSSELTGEGRSVLERQAAWLNQNQNVGISIEGHADERGTREYNLALGERRAQASKNYLVSLGVPADRLNTISYGKERPAVMGSDEQAHSKNRRAVTVVQ